MQNQAGLWIDHKEAFVVFVGAETGALQHMASNMEKHVRYSGHSAAEEGSADDQRDRQFAAHLEKYYDEVITLIRDAKSILLFGPGEAKGEFRKRYQAKGPGGSIVGFETVDKMTEHQIKAKVQAYFEKSSVAVAKPR